MKKFIRFYNDIQYSDLALVGGKNASLGEMYFALNPMGISIPQGFAVTSEAYKAFLKKNNLEKSIFDSLSAIKGENTDEMARAGKKIRDLIKSAEFDADLKNEIKDAYEELCKRTNKDLLDVAVRSSATAEDLPNVSFAGLHESYLNIRGEQQLIEACRNCFASLFTDRAISYRIKNGFDHSKVYLSVGVQQMIRSDLASSGVMFTLDTESGANNIIFINSSYGLGENIVGGKVDPDEILISKPLVGKAQLPILKRRIGAKQMKLVYFGKDNRETKNLEVSREDQKRLSLEDADAIKLAGWGIKIEEYFSNLHDCYTPMDIEWAKDGQTGQLFIVQARPETVHSQNYHATNFVLKKKSKILLKGRAVGNKIGAGPVKIIRTIKDFPQFMPGDVLVADMTDPDWEPIMKKAAAVITNKGGRTCHAAIISREHGVPCIVGTEKATDLLSEHSGVTVSCAEGDEGIVYEGVLPYSEEEIRWNAFRKPKTKIMINMANPAQAFQFSTLPVDGVGLVRMEFIISELIRIHPMALVKPESVKELNVKKEIDLLVDNYQSGPQQYFIDKLSEGLATIAGAFYPRPVIIRFSDFKSNEYSNLLGGSAFEENEENPMIGFRGASRYYNESYKDGFALECKAIKYIRDIVGLKNIKVMIPFCRSPEEGKKVIDEMKKHGLIKGQNGLEVYVMCEIPSNVLRAEEFSMVFDGFSIGSNDLTQMVLAVDRDSTKISPLFNERDPAVILMIKMAIGMARKNNRPIGICGQAPSDYPEFSKFLVEEGINSISVTPDAVFKTILTVLESESEAEHLHHNVHQ